MRGLHLHVDCASGVEHDGSPGPNTVNVIVPDGVDPPESAPESEICPPATTLGDAAVTSDGDASGATTVTDSPLAPHAAPAGLFAASPP